MVKLETQLTFLPRPFSSIYFWRSHVDLLNLFLHALQNIEYVFFCDSLLLFAI